MPILNTLPFLRERFDTILAQTIPDWELFVYDSHSDDGSWEFVQDVAKRESRMRLLQGPREGVYAAWNECLRQTNAEYVYIATSDDTMAPDCLEKMAVALAGNEDCDLAHCPLRIINESGAPSKDVSWPACTVFGHATAQFLDRPHVRRAPYDGLLHLSGAMVYMSITQLLMRRSLFARIGGFETRWGPLGDRNWEMKAGLVSNTIHVPGTWATWRVHSAQASRALSVHSLEYARKIEEMIQDAWLACQPCLPTEVVAGVRDYWLGRSRDLRAYYAHLRSEPSIVRRRLFQVVQTLRGTNEVRSEIARVLCGSSKWPDRAPDEILDWLESLGFSSVIVDRS